MIRIPRQVKLGGPSTAPPSNGGALFQCLVSPEMIIPAATVEEQRTCLTSFYRGKAGESTCGLIVEREVSKETFPPVLWKALMSAKRATLSTATAPNYNWEPVEDSTVPEPVEASIESKPVEPTLFTPDASVSGSDSDSGCEPDEDEDEDSVTAGPVEISIVPELVEADIDSESDDETTLPTPAASDSESDWEPDEEDSVTPEPVESNIVPEPVEDSVDSEPVGARIVRELIEATTLREPDVFPLYMTFWAEGQKEAVLASHFLTRMEVAAGDGKVVSFRRNGDKAAVSITSVVHKLAFKDDDIIKDFIDYIDRGPKNGPGLKKMITTLRNLQTLCNCLKDLIVNKGMYKSLRKNPKQVTFLLQQLMLREQLGFVLRKGLNLYFDVEKKVEVDVEDY